MSSPVRWLVGTARGEGAARSAFASWVLEHPVIRHLHPRYRDDAVQDVVLHYLERAPEIAWRLEPKDVVQALLRGDPVPEGRLRAADRRLDAYVRQSLRNRVASLARRAGREVAELPAEPVAPDDLGLDPADLARRVLERVEAHVLAHGAGREEDRRRTLDELKALALGEVRMDALVDRELEGVTEPAERTRARDRLYVRHRRMREALAQAIDQLEAEGALRAEEAEAARVVVAHVLKRRQTGGSRA